jgi:hypothetical protein
MFLMATSAIGPGFITQTAQFTAQLGAAFTFAILVSVLVDAALQLNVWPGRSSHTQRSFQASTVRPFNQRWSVERSAVRILTGWRTGRSWGR